MAAPVQPGEFPVPEESRQRRGYAIKMMSYGGIFLLIAVAATVYAAVTGAEMGGLLAMGGLILATLSVMGWGFYWYHKHAHFSYEAGPVEFIFTSHEYFVPQEVMSRFLACVLETWAPHLDTPVESVYSGVRIYIEKNRPIDPLGRTDKVVGLTYHASSRSHVWGPYALDPGGLGYELLLHGAEHRWPNSNEAQKIDRMGELDLFRTLSSKFEQQFPDRA